MEDIAMRVGISRSALYAMFESKEALFRALVTALIDDVMPRLLPDDIGDVPAPHALRGLVRALMVRMTREDLAFLPRLIVGEGRMFPDLVRFYHDHGIARVLGALEQVIRHGIAREEFDPVDPGFAARSVVGGILLSALWRIVFEPAGAAPLDIEAMASHHADMMLFGLCAQKDTR